MATLTQIKQRFWDNDGTLLSGGKVYIYLAGTSTLTNSYTDSTGLVANTNPVILDAKGEASIWTNGLVKINVLNSADVQVTGYPVDYVGEEVPANLKGMPINLNGNFQIAQAGTSFAAPAGGAYDLDGWLEINTSAAVYTVTQGTGSSANKLARIITITTADAAVAAGDIVRDETRIEGYDIVPLVGNTFTVSFNAKFPVTGIHCVSLRNNANDRSYVHEINVASANTWASYSFTVVGGLPTAGTWGYTNSAALKLGITAMAGSAATGTPATADTWMTGSYFTTANQVNDCATIGNVWALEDVRIDLGSVPGTDWPSYQENLARCQRYYYRKIPGVNRELGLGYNQSATLSAAFTQFPVVMRTAPTAVEQTGTATDYRIYSAAGGIVCSAVPAFDQATIYSARTLFTVAAGLTSGQGSNGDAATSTGYLGWSARL